MAKILVIGGAGYIGSVCVSKLLELGDEVVVIDNLSTGYRDNVSANATFFEGDFGDKNFVREVLSKEKCELAIHFGAASLVPESVSNPSKYFGNNVGKGALLLDSLLEAGCKSVIFSSTAAIFGNPQTVPIKENDEKSPINPYGLSKYMFEQILEWYHNAYGLKFVSLRYFNACGATASTLEAHSPETHLIPIIFDVVLGKRPILSIFGDDYDTPDGTCVRDYVHVSDLIDAHIRAIKYLELVPCDFFNLGNGNGYSVLEVVRAVEKVTGKLVPTRIDARREGDPATLVASSQKARDKLGWRPKFETIESIVKTVWAKVRSN